MGNQIYSRNEYTVYRAGSSFVVLNRRKFFSEGHTHLNSFSSAKYIIDLAIRGRIPNHLSPYLLTSLYRISEDEVYRGRLTSLIAGKMNRRQKYTNTA